MSGFFSSSPDTRSMLVNLACRFYEPTGGKIYIDGEDYTQIPLM